MSERIFNGERFVEHEKLFLFFCDEKFSFSGRLLHWVTRRKSRKVLQCRWKAKIASQPWISHSPTALNAGNGMEIEFILLIISGFAFFGFCFSSALHNGIDERRRRKMHWQSRDTQTHIERLFRSRSTENSHQRNSIHNRRIWASESWRTSDILMGIEV